MNTISGLSDWPNEFREMLRKLESVTLELTKLSYYFRQRSSVVEQLIRNQQVAGSIPAAGSLSQKGL